MAREEDLEVTDDWQQLTNADVTEITFLNHGPFPIRIRYVVGAVLPTGVEGDRYGPGQGERQVSPPGSTNRVYARAVGGRARVSVRHT